LRSVITVLVTSEDAWIVALLGALAGIYLFFRGFRVLQRRRLIRDTPTSKIRSASMGLVEVCGLATGPHVMKAPITNLPCYYYRSMVWQWKQAGKNKEWVKIIDESLHLPFYLDDNTGRVLVNPQGAELDIHRDFHEEYSPSLFSDKDFVPVNVSNFLARHGFGNDREKIKVDEYCIKPKNALFILGTLAENTGVEVSAKPVPTLAATGTGVTFSISGFKDDPLQSVLGAVPGMMQTTVQTTSFSTVITTRKYDPGAGTSPEIIRLHTDSSKPLTADQMTQQQKIAAALTKAGISNPAAWAAAGVDPGPTTAAVVTPENGIAVDNFDLKPKVALMKGTHNPAFFISWRSQRDVLASLGWKSALYIWCGPILTLLCSYLLAIHFGLL
jgi:E3 ubiquitin ligase